MTATIILGWALCLAIVVILGMAKASKAADVRLRRSWSKCDLLSMEARLLRLELDQAREQLPAYGRDPKTGKFAKKEAA